MMMTDNLETFSSYDPSDDHKQPHDQVDCSAVSFTTNNNNNVEEDPAIVKKLYHNASERNRRKKINSLFSSLRSLLPATSQSKKLTIPATVSYVLKHIPELQEQVESLIQKKKELLSRISSISKIRKEMQLKYHVRSSLSSNISSTRLSDREVMIQISTHKFHDKPFSEILLNLEKDGLRLINASSFESFGGRVFYNLHLQVERTHRLECEVLSEKLLSLYEKKEEYLFPSKSIWM